MRGACVCRGGSEEEARLCAQVKIGIQLFLWGTLFNFCSCSFLAILRDLMGSSLLGGSKSDIND